VVLNASFAWKTDKRRQSSKDQILRKLMIELSDLMKFGRRLAREKAKTANDEINLILALLVVDRYLEA